MTTDELIEAGICEDVVEVLRVFPVEMLADFAPADDFTDKYCVSRRGKHPIQATTNEVDSTRRKHAGKD